MPGPVADVQALWTDTARWPNFVDGFEAVDQVDAEWPRSGRIVWHSKPHGRGRVIERTVGWVEGEYVVDVEDEKTRARQTVVFQELSEEVDVSLTLDYTLKNASFVERMADRLFIRRSIRDALRRTAERFARERRGDVSP